MNVLSVEQLRELALWNSFQCMCAQKQAMQQAGIAQQLSEQLDVEKRLAETLAQQLANGAVDARVPAAPAPEVLAVNDGSQAEGSTPE